MTSETLTGHTESPSRFNAVNRGVYIADNLPFLQSLNSESIDLVVIDPPFGKNQTFTGKLRPPLTEKEREVEASLLASWGVTDVDGAYDMGIEYPDQEGETAKFSDIWRFERVLDEDWWQAERQSDSAVYWLIRSTRRTHGDSTAAYIAFMARRLVEIWRVLKPTGSVYLHCDHAANAYLRQLMDAVFGQSNFRNEIVWKRTARGFKGSQFKPRTFNANTERILFYSKTCDSFFDAESHDPVTFASQFKFEDDKGRYFLDYMHNRRGASARPNLCYEYKGFHPPHPSGWMVGPTRMKELDDAGELVVADGELRRKVRPKAGLLRNNLWDDINEVRGEESTGYPTQKPQALARRLIESSSNPGEIVLDCFAGCAYVPVAAEELGRRWVACDVSPRAWTVVRRQFAKKPELAMTVEGEEDLYDDASPDFEGRGSLRVFGLTELPTRSPDDWGTGVVRQGSHMGPIGFRQKVLETPDEIWHAFVQEWDVFCWYCGNAKPADRRELHLDHVEPNARDGSNDDCWNRALACAPCNSDKGDKLTPRETIEKAFEAGRIGTPARRDEMFDQFERRHQWARERFESLKSQ